MNRCLEAAKMQGFVWDKLEYEFRHASGWTKVRLSFDEQTYKVLLQRYRELFEHGGHGGEPKEPYEIDTDLTERGAGTIDAEYINDRFIRFIKNSIPPGRAATSLRLPSVTSTRLSLPFRSANSERL